MTAMMPTIMITINRMGHTTPQSKSRPELDHSERADDPQLRLKLGRPKPSPRMTRSKLTTKAFQYDVRSTSLALRFKSLRSHMINLSLCLHYVLCLTIDTIDYVIRQTNNYINFWLKSELI
ncbi:hypothetical protein D3C75_947470 [compost metagenome]